MIKQTAFKLITILSLLASIGGCTIKSKEQTKQAPIATSSTSREDKEAINKKQIAFLKEHEQEIVDFVKSKNSKKEIKQFIESLRVVGDSQLINILEVKLDQFGIHIN